MAEDSSNPLGLPPTVWIAVIVGLAGVFALNQRPFQDVRPTDASAPVYRHTPSEDQDVEARLWEDPLGAAAAAKAADDREAAAAADRKAAAVPRPPANPPAADSSSPAGTSSSPACFAPGKPKRVRACPHAPSAAAAPLDHSTKRLRNFLKANVDSVESVLVVGAMVPGAPYADDIETRRRIRYAVLAGLHRAAFVPMNNEHVGYITLAEFYEDDPTHGHDIAAYEWLTSDEVTGEPAPHDRVLILWLDQDGFRVRPLWHFQRIVDAIDPSVKIVGDAVDTASAVDLPGPKIRMTAVIMGPADSDGLFSMRGELEPCKDAAKCNSALTVHRPIAIYSSRATAADEWLLDKKGACRAQKDPPARPEDALAENLFSWSHQLVTLYRLVTDDCTVTQALRKELGHRGVQDPGQIALVAERDTLYARRMGEYFGGCAVSPRIGATIRHDPSLQQPLCFTYLRGLDGIAPPVADAGDVSKKSAAGKGSNSSASSDTTGTPSEAATGQGQLDYLRRLATALAARVDENGCRKSAKAAPDSPASIDAAATCPPNGIMAIGVLGSDVYDKLLVLQALRNSFPRVVFFTTDLDARLLDSTSLQWTRHLVVGSSLGLELSPELQSSIPPFRDSYQAATYFSTLLAMHRYLKADVAEAAAAPATTSISPADLSLGLEWTMHPHVFEIGRTQAFDLTDEPQRPAGCDLDKACESIAAPGRVSFWNDRSWLVGFQLGALLTALTMVVLWFAKGTAWCVETLNVFKSPVVNRPLRRRRIRVLSSFVALLIVSTAVWPYLVTWLTFGRTRLPTPIFGGASLWAAGLIEAASVVVVIALLLRGQRKLNENIEQIQTEFQLQKSGDELIAWRREQLPSWTRRWREMYWFPSNKLSTDSETPPRDGQLSPVEALMARYLFRGHSRARLVRVTVATVLSTAALLLLELRLGKSLVGGTQLLRAGNSESAWVAGISILSLMALQWLIFWVADAIFLSRSFFLDLLRHQPAWPPTLVQNESRRLALREEWTTMWLNLRLIGLRTDCVAGLVIYPSIVIAGLTLAALTVEFGEMGFASNPIALIGSAALVVLAAVLLRRVAESWRHSVRTRLEDARLALQATGPDSGAVSQLKSLLGRVNNLREGAFASYAQQPLVKAVLVPALTFAATVGLQYLHLTP